MDSVICLKGCSAVLYAGGALGVLAWLVFSTVRLIGLGPAIATLWNLVTSTLCAVAWGLLPVLWLLHCTGRQSLFKVLGILELILVGPLLLVFCLVGSFWDAIDYQLLCSGPCVTASVDSGFDFAGHPLDAAVLLLSDQYDCCDHLLLLPNGVRQHRAAAESGAASLRGS